MSESSEKAVRYLIIYKYLFRGVSESIPVPCDTPMIEICLRNTHKSVKSSLILFYLVYPCFNVLFSLTGKWRNSVSCSYLSELYIFVIMKLKIGAPYMAEVLNSSVYLYGLQTVWCPALCLMNSFIYLRSELGTLRIRV